MLCEMIEGNVAMMSLRLKGNACLDRYNVTSEMNLFRDYTLFFIRNLAKGLVLKVPYFRTSFYQILVLKVP